MFINRLGNILHGIGGGSHACIDNIPLPLLTFSDVNGTYNLTSSAAIGWWDDETIVIATQLSPVPLGWEDPFGLAIVFVHLPTNSVSIIRQHGCAYAEARTNVWAFGDGGYTYNGIHVPGHGLVSSYGLNIPEGAFITVGPDKSVCYKPIYQSAGPTRIRESNGDDWQLMGGDGPVQLLGEGKAIYVETGVLKTKDAPMPVLLEGQNYGVKLIWFANEWWTYYISTKLGMLVMHPANRFIGKKITDGNHADGVDVVVLEDGRVKIGWAIAKQEQAGQMQSSTLSASDFIEDLNPGNPIPVPQGEIMIKSFERPMWMAPYWSHSEKYGYTPIENHQGNAIWSTAEDYGNNKQYNFPIILDVNGFPIIGDENLVIAYYVSGLNIDELVSKVDKAKDYPARPIIAYLDGDEWPDSNPFPPDISDRVWPSIQAYRFADEALTAFESRVSVVINKVLNYNLWMFLTTRFDDFNGSQTVAAIEECMPSYESWLRFYPFVGHMPFSDRRGNAISSNPSLQAHAKAFYYAIPSGLPNRNDYWHTAGQSIEDILKNKFGQSRAAIVMEPYLRTDVINHYEDEPNPPEPPNPGEPASLEADVQKERDKYGDIPSDDDKAAILNSVAWKNRALGWGLSGKESGNHVNQPHTGKGIASDILHHKLSNLIYDVFRGIPELPVIWDLVGEQTDPNRPWVEPVQP